MPTVYGRRCPLCGSAVVHTPEGQVPNPKDPRHTLTDHDSCSNEKCEWESGVRRPDAKTAPAGSFAEDIAS